MRLGTMLFALHLNASNVHEDGEGTAALKHCIGNTVLCYLRSQSRGLLLVASVEAGLAGECADYLSATLLARFERRFGAQLDARAAAGRRCTLKRQAFAADLVHVIASLASWIVERAEGEHGSTSACGSARASEQQPGASSPANPGAGCSLGAPGSLAAGCRPPALCSLVGGCSLMAVLHDPICQALRRPSASAAGGMRRPPAEGVGGACGCLPRVWAGGGPTDRMASRTHSARRPAPRSRRVAAEAGQAAPMVATSVGQGAAGTAAGDPDPLAPLATSPALPRATGLLLRAVQAAADTSRCQPFSNSIYVPADFAGALTPLGAEGGERADCDAGGRRTQSIVLVRPPLLLCLQLGKALIEAQVPQAAAEAAEVMDRWVTPLRLTMTFWAALLRRAEQQGPPSGGGGAATQPPTYLGRGASR